MNTLHVYSFKNKQKTKNKNNLLLQYFFFQKIKYDCGDTTATLKMEKKTWYIPLHECKIMK
jgi:hypothetical protein